MKYFVFQPNPCISQFEKRIIRHAWAIGSDIIISNDPDQCDQPIQYCPVGSVEFCRSWMDHCGIPEPDPIDYPHCLREHLRRYIITLPFCQAQIGSWVKPVYTKLWDAHIKTAGDAIPPQCPTWQTGVIPPNQWVGEWRIYVIDGTIVGCGRYDDNEADETYDQLLVQSMVDTYTASGAAPAGYGLDIATLSDGTTILVEVTDGWAIGYYRGTCTSIDYATLLSSRWLELSQNTKLSHL